jgi:outer membrane protein OmpA-like peptidoglycan-associated protein
MIVVKKEYNKILSFNRAKNVADYFLAKRLKSDRVTFKGYGDSKPIIKRSSFFSKMKNEH